MFCNFINLDESILNVNFKLSDGVPDFSKSLRGYTDRKLALLCHLHAPDQALGCPVTLFRPNDTVSFMWQKTKKQKESNKTRVLGFRACKNEFGSIKT